MAYTDNQIQQRIQAATGRNATDYEISKYGPASPEQFQNIPNIYSSYDTKNSISDYLAHSGQDPSFDARAKLAGQYGVNDYQGTADQNVGLLGMLKNGAPSQSQPPVQGSIQSQPVPAQLAPSQQTPVQGQGQGQQTSSSDPYWAQYENLGVDTSRAKEALNVANSLTPQVQSAKTDYMDAQTRVQQFDQAIKQEMQTYKDQASRAGGVPMTDAEARTLVSTYNQNLLNQRNAAATEQANLGRTYQNVAGQYAAAQKQAEYQQNELDKSRQFGLNQSKATATEDLGKARLATTQDLGNKRLALTARGQDIRQALGNANLSVRSMLAGITAGKYENSIGSLPLDAQLKWQTLKPGLASTQSNLQKADTALASFNTNIDKVSSLAKDLNISSVAKFNTLKQQYDSNVLDKNTSAKVAQYLTTLDQVQRDYGSIEGSLTGTRSIKSIQGARELINQGWSSDMFDEVKKSVNGGAKASIDELDKSARDAIQSVIGSKGQSQNQSTQKAAPSTSAGKDLSHINFKF